MTMDRRKFLVQSGSLLSAAPIFFFNSGNSSLPDGEPIIDIHQHIQFKGRSNTDLIKHQDHLGIKKTILLPSGSPVDRASTHFGKANGLAAEAGGNESCLDLAEKYKGKIYFGVNEVPDLEDSVKVIESYLKRGAKVIGEVKFGVDCDSPDMQRIYSLAEEFNVPILMHWEYQMYNYGFARFYKMLEKYPNVNFIGHAQTWWANIDKDYTDPNNLYPKGSVIPGGMTDRLLSDYENMYGDLSANSGLNSLMRDEDHARYFLEKHQDKLMFGSDCHDSLSGGGKCIGEHTISAIRRLSSGRVVRKKILYKNASRLFGI